MTKKLMIGLSLAAMTVAGAGVAYAQTGDGTTTRAEAQTRAATMFARMDANSDGKLDTADRAAHQAAMFARLDTDNSGSISPAEMTAGHARSPAAAAGPDGAERGHRSGGHRMGGSHMGGRGHGGGMMMMRMADTNHDQAVSQAEFTAKALQHFDSADTNKDGTLTRAERQAAHQAMRTQMKDRHGEMGHGDMPPPPPGN
ncbi:MAG TPA: hypothetical protein VHG29_05055 [Novosphingobium sp.]|nr:hypothetical protein [Novosphingobium sp.]